MQFLYPWFLAALGTLVIPILIHLFYFRRFKKVYFSSVRFLKEIKDETNTRTKLKNLLVLFCRLLALAFLVMAFAQPILQKKNQGIFPKSQIGLFIDNSYSMNAQLDETPLISLAKQRARTIVESYGLDDQFMVLTHDFDGKSARLVARDEALNMIDQIQATPAVKTLAESYGRIRSIIGKPEGNKHIYLVSDFQKSITAMPSTIDTNIQMHLIPIQSVQEKNVSIDTAWFDSPTAWLDRPNLLKFKLTNYGDQPVENIRISLNQNGQSKPLGLQKIAPGQSIIDTAQISITRPGWQKIVLEITDYPIQFDDQLYLAFTVNESTRIHVISGTQLNANLKVALESLPAIKWTQGLQSKVNYAELSENQLIILDDLPTVSTGLVTELMNACKEGTNLLIFPGPSADISNYNNLMAAFGGGSLLGYDKRPFQASEINTQEFVFNDVFTRVTANMRLPSVQGRYERVRGTTADESIISFPDGKPLISKYKWNKGSIYFSSTPLNEAYSDLSKNAEIFIPMLFRMALNKNQIEKVAYFIGLDNQIEIQATRVVPNDIITLRQPNQPDLIPPQRSQGNKMILQMEGLLDRAGFYDSHLQDSLVAILPFNFNRKESNLALSTIDDLKQKFPTADLIEASNSQAFASLFINSQNGNSYWKWFLVITLVFLLLESLILRFWKN
jgi:hypothetical protein